MALVDKLEIENVIKRGHFLLTSGRHSDVYINKDAIFCNPDLFNDVINIMYMKVHQLDFDVVTGPAIAGAVLAAPLARNLGKIFVYPEKIINGPACPISEGMQFRRGYDKVLKDKKVILIEDIITTGGSVLKTIDAIHECGGTVEKVIAIWNRSKWTTEHCEVDSIIKETVESWEADDCPMCEAWLKEEHHKCDTCPSTECDCEVKYPLTDPKTGYII